MPHSNHFTLIYPTTSHCIITTFSVNNIYRILDSVIHLLFKYLLSPLISLYLSLAFKTEAISGEKKGNFSGIKSTLYCGCCHIFLNSNIMTYTGYEIVILHTKECILEVQKYLVKCHFSLVLCWRVFLVVLGWVFCLRIHFVVSCLFCFLTTENLSLWRPISLYIQKSFNIQFPP